MSKSLREELIDLQLASKSVTRSDGYKSIVTVTNEDAADALEFLDAREES